MPVVLGALLPPAAVAFGISVPASDSIRLAILSAFVVSGALIGRWWAPAPSLLTWIALGMAEEANHRGFGPGSRIGTAIEIHSGGDFSVSFFALTTLIAIILPTMGWIGRVVFSALYQRSRRR